VRNRLRRAAKSQTRAPTERASGSHFDPQIVEVFVPIAVEVHDECVRMEMLIRDAVAPVEPVAV